jgi:GNAT superfamily N-acetyltransferase
VSESGFVANPVRAVVGSEGKAFFFAALAELTPHRGGRALLVDWMRTERVQNEEELFLSLVKEQRLAAYFEDDELVGCVAVSGDVQHWFIAGIFVLELHRRRGYGSALMAHCHATWPDLKDAWSLPGDGPTKSLYESMGWKARQLTMSAE